ncbi:hypothetical protein [Streptomyces sp. BE230]|uniref:hypothetical protein n=1 Tax=Streptomyces sp. BE230 TaxID=3002526 RepID=UPI002ED125B9|nr:hypothetical protein [Streptomyces sp. BE230]
MAESSASKWPSPVDLRGTVVHNDGTTQDAELRAAVAELTRLLNDLRPVLTPDQDQTVAGALPALTPDRDALRERGMVLASVSQIAATVGEVGRPVVEALGRLFALLGYIVGTSRRRHPTHNAYGASTGAP